MCNITKLHDVSLTLFLKNNANLKLKKNKKLIEDQIEI